MRCFNILPEAYVQSKGCSVVFREFKLLFCCLQQIRASPHQHQLQLSHTLNTQKSCLKIKFQVWPFPPSQWPMTSFSSNGLHMFYEMTWCCVCIQFCFSINCNNLLFRPNVKHHIISTSATPSTLPSAIVIPLKYFTTLHCGLETVMTNTEKHRLVFWDSALVYDEPEACKMFW